MDVVFCGPDSSRVAVWRSPSTSSLASLYHFSPVVYHLQRLSSHIVLISSPHVHSSFHAPHKALWYSLHSIYPRFFHSHSSHCLLLSIVIIPVKLAIHSNDQHNLKMSFQCIKCIKVLIAPIHILCPATFNRGFIPHEEITASIHYTVVGIPWRHRWRHRRHSSQ